MHRNRADRRSLRPGSFGLTVEKIFASFAAPQKAEWGVAKPDKYNIRAMADFTENNDGTDEIATGKVLVTVPSRLLGF